MAFLINVFCFYNLPLIGGIVCVKRGRGATAATEAAEISKLLRLRFAVLIAFGWKSFPGATANCDTAV